MIILNYCKLLTLVSRWPSWAPRGEFLFIDQVSYIAPLMHLGCTHVWKLLNGRVHCPILKAAPVSRAQVRHLRLAYTCTVL